MQKFKNADVFGPLKFKGPNQTNTLAAISITSDLRFCGCALKLTPRCGIDQWPRLHLEVGTMVWFWFTPRCRMGQWSRLHLEVGNMARCWSTSGCRTDQWSRLYLEVGPQKSGKRGSGWGSGWGSGCGLGLRGG